MQTCIKETVKIDGKTVKIEKVVKRANGSIWGYVVRLYNEFLGIFYTSFIRHEEKE